MHTDDSIYRADNEFAKNFPKQGAAGKCSVLHSYTIDYENQDAGCFVNICGFTADDEQTENLFFKSESIEAGKWTEELNSILFDKIQVTVCVAFEDGTSKTQTIAIAAAASDANSTYEKGQTQKEKLIQYEMR